MSIDHSQFGARAAAAWAIALWLAVGVSVEAAASPVTLYFDGQLGWCGEGGALTQCGVSQADALASGIPIEEPTYVVDAEGILLVADQDVQVSSLDSLFAASGNTATSTWQVQNVYPHDLIGDTYILFVTTAPYPTRRGDVTYDPSDVGLSIDPDLGWVLIHTNAGPGMDYYFPAMSLGSLAQGELASAFDVNFVIDTPLQQVGSEIVLPRFQTGMGFEPAPEPSGPVPEPTGAVLMGVGLILLATLHRRSS